MLRTLVLPLAMLVHVPIPTAGAVTDSADPSTALLHACTEPLTLHLRDGDSIRRPGGYLEFPLCGAQHTVEWPAMPMEAPLQDAYVFWPGGEVRMQRTDDGVKVRVRIGELHSSAQRLKTNAAEQPLRWDTPGDQTIPPALADLRVRLERPGDMTGLQQQVSVNATKVPADDLILAATRIAGLRVSPAGGADTASCATPVSLRFETLPVVDLMRLIGDHCDLDVQFMDGHRLRIGHAADHAALRGAFDRLQAGEDEETVLLQWVELARPNDPDDIEPLARHAHLDLARYALEDGRPGEAATHLQAALDQVKRAYARPDPELLLRLAEVRLRQQRERMAGTLLQRALDALATQDPDGIGADWQLAHRLQGELAILRSDRTTAIHAYEQALAVTSQLGWIDAAEAEALERQEHLLRQRLIHALELPVDQRSP